MLHSKCLLNRTYSSARNLYLLCLDQLDDPLFSNSMQKKLLNFNEIDNKTFKLNVQTQVLLCGSSSL